MRIRPPRSAVLAALLLALAAALAPARPADAALPAPVPARAAPARRAQAVGRARPAVRRRHAARYRPPVDAPVRDPFRPPACTWCAGNRGLEYETVPGTPVVASAAGTVTFAGPVARTLWVVVGHADGLRTSYGLLDALAVAVGQRVAAGQVLGSAGSAVHFGVRRGDVYLDPALLLAGAAPVPRLVPLDAGPGRWSPAARAARTGWVGARAPR